MIRSCIDCAVEACSLNGKKAPEFCTANRIEDEALQDAMKLYDEEENQTVAINAAIVESDNYCKMTRLEETIEFAKRMNAHKIGIATCVGLLSEARIVGDILRKYGFEVYGIACKSGSQLKEDIGIPDRCNVTGKVMCNPILQAKMCNEEKTDLNIVIGLCVGHDSLFSKYSDALVTTLVVKDRVLGHNPVAAIYQADKYYDRIYNIEE